MRAASPARRERRPEAAKVGTAPPRSAPDSRRSQPPRSLPSPPSRRRQEPRQLACALGWPDSGHKPQVPSPVATSIPPPLPRPQNATRNQPRTGNPTNSAHGYRGCLARHPQRSAQMPREQTTNPQVSGPRRYNTRRDASVQRHRRCAKRTARPPSGHAEQQTTTTTARQQHNATALPDRPGHHNTVERRLASKADRPD